MSSCIQIRCASCGFEDNADLVVSINIRRAGLTLIARGDIGPAQA